jgi:hypothetical protein
MTMLDTLYKNGIEYATLSPVVVIFSN